MAGPAVRSPTAAVVLCRRPITRRPVDDADDDAWDCSVGESATSADSLVPANADKWADDEDGEEGGSAAAAPFAVGASST